MDGAIKRYALYEGNRYPEKVADLIPGYLSLGEGGASHLEQLSYRTDTKAGYRLSLNSFPIFANGDTSIRRRVDKTGKIDIL